MIGRLFRQIVYVAVFLELLFLAFYFGLPKLLVPNTVVRAEVPAQELELELYGQDWFPPRVGINVNDRDIAYSKTEISISSNEQIVESDLPEGWSLNGEEKNEELFYYVIATNTIPDGSKTYELSFSDESGNATLRNLKLDASKDRTKITEWRDYEYTAYPFNPLSLVSKKYKLPEDFVPHDLVSLTSLGIRNNNSAHLRKEAASSLKSMLGKVSEAGIDYTVTSGYRSYTDQVSAYQFWLGYYSGDTDATDLVSARPGFSEHQLGMTLDFTTSANGNVFSGFQFTPLSDWLATNAYKYGFALSYPEGKTERTGYIFEPWHYRYIGKENAKDFKDSGLTLIEWLEKQNEL